MQKHIAHSIPCARTPAKSHAVFGNSSQPAGPHAAVAIMRVCTLSDDEVMTCDCARCCPRQSLVLNTESSFVNGSFRRAGALTACDLLQVAASIAAWHAAKLSSDPTQRPAAPASLFEPNPTTFALPQLPTQVKPLNPTPNL
jgi:hypothetical protein